jgi:hypothetical protein
MLFANGTCLPAGRIHGFVLDEDTKPAHDHHLQTTPTLPQASLLLT